VTSLRVQPPQVGASLCASVGASVGASVETLVGSGLERLANHSELAKRTYHRERSFLPVTAFGKSGVSSLP
jgi:hypothetical protein